MKCVSRTWHRQEYPRRLIFFLNSIHRVAQQFVPSSTVTDTLPRTKASSLYYSSTARHTPQTSLRHPLRRLYSCCERTGGFSCNIVISKDTVPIINGMWRKSPAASFSEARTGAKLPGAMVGSQSCWFKVASTKLLLTFAIV